MFGYRVGPCILTTGRWEPLVSIGGKAVLPYGDRVLTREWSSSVRTLPD